MKAHNLILTTAIFSLPLLVFAEGANNRLVVMYCQPLTY